MGDVFDLDALAREEAGEPFTFRFDGLEYTLPPTLDIRAVAALSAGRLDDALRLLLGDDQWAKLQQADGVFDHRHLDSLFTAYAEHVGIELGESSASTATSNREARRSRPTSSGTTKSR